MDREAMRSITRWSLCASVHDEPVPYQVTAAVSCAPVTMPRPTARGSRNGESGSNREGRRQVLAARARVNCRRVMSILTCSSLAKSYSLGGTFWLKAKKLLQRTYGQHGLGSARALVAARRSRTAQWIVPGPQVEPSSPCMLGLQLHFSEGGRDRRSTLIR